MLMSAPTTINWNFTDACNFNCRHCYSRGRAKESPLTRAQLLRIANALAEANVFSVNLGGGEPLLDPNVYDVIECLSSRHVVACLSTNGWNLDDDAIQRLRDAHLSTLFVSVDSHDPDVHDYIRNQKGSHARAIRTIKSCVRHDLEVSFSTVVSSYNWRDLGQIVDLADSLGVEKLNIKRFRPVGNGEKNMDEFVIRAEDEEEMLELVERLTNTSGKAITFLYLDFPVAKTNEGCPCGRTALGVMPDGSLKMCVYGTVVIGNILHDDLREVWLHHPYLVQNRIEHVCEGLAKETVPLTVRG